jgi:hypothetical protein
MVLRADQKILHQHVQKNLFIARGIVSIERGATRKHEVEKQITQSELYFMLLIHFDTLSGCIEICRQYF